MNERTASRLSLALLVATIAAGAGTFVALAIGTAVTYGGQDRGSPLAGLLIVVVAAAASLLGRLIVRRAGNAIGWAFQAMALAAVVSLGTEVIIGLAAERAPSSGFFGMDLGQRPSPETGGPKEVAVGTGLGIELLGWINRLSFLGLVLPIPAIFLLFPTGRPLSPRWRWALRLWAASAILAIVWAALRPDAAYGAPPAGSLPGIHIDAPFGLHGVDPLFDVLGTGGAVAGIVAGGLGVVSLVIRFRRGRGEERAQMKWLALVGAAAGAVMLVMFLSDLILGEDALGSSVIGSILFFTLVVLLLVGMPAAVAIAVLKYRLYDIDVVIRKTVVFGGLAAFITLVYVGVVVGVGGLVGRGEEPSVGLSIAATAILAIAFQPVRERVQRFANRLVYGKRATPYEVLTRFSERVAGTYATEDVLPRTARVIAEGTGAARVDVWLRVGDELRPAASWPEDADPRDEVGLHGDALPSLGAGRTAAVRLGEELLGAITVDKPASEPFRPSEEALLQDLAGQAGLVLSNVRLTAELEANLDRITAQAAALRASRQRIVVAQDAERRRLERNIHDGAQQHLVAIAVKLRLAKQVLGRDPSRARSMLLELQEAVGEALDTLTSLALGIYPPLLEEQGIGAALAAQYPKAGLPVRMRTDGLGRYPIEAEAAVYFCVLEALQNAGKYANATAIEVDIREDGAALSFEVADDGRGFDPATTPKGSGLQNISDRLSVLGGDVVVESAPGRGTTVRGRVPISALEAAR